MTEDKDVELYKKFQKSPIFFIEKMFQLKPQVVKPEYKQLVQDLVEEGKYKQVKVSYFEEFIKGKHVSWQQWLILLAVERGLNGLSNKRISVTSGHGIGKSTTLAWLIIWYLFCFKDAQIPATAPTSDQLHDVLWKELALWLGRLPKEVSDLYDWTTGYLRIRERPETWFARAKTARKESPEALAGIHADYVMMIVDEASGIPEEIFNTAEGALTGENVLVIMISNPTRLLGYFYDSHHSDSENWQVLQFDSEDSPVVKEGYVSRMEQKHGRDSDEFRLRVKGVFPKEDAIDEKGYVPLVVESDIRMTSNDDFVGRCKLGVDPSGEGSDETSWVKRDNFRAKTVMSEKISNSKSIAQSTMALQLHGNIDSYDITCDNFGVGANVARELALARVEIEAINVGEPAEDKERFINIRAEAFWRLREWLKKGGEIYNDPLLKKELLSIRFKRNLRGRIQIMSKKEMREMGYQSPNRADALMLTFVEDDMEGIAQTSESTKEDLNSSI